MLGKKVRLQEIEESAEYIALIKNYSSEIGSKVPSESNLYMI